MKTTKALFGILIITAAILAVTMDCQSQTTIRVPQDQSTITAGIAAAHEGDIVLVSNGTYQEHNIAITNAITLKSVNGSSATTIDGQGLGVVLYANSTSSNWVKVQGFTVTNGWAPQSSPIGGNGISWESGFLQVSNCIIENCTGDGVPGGNNSGSEYWNNIQFIDCIVRNNSVQNYAGLGGATAIRCVLYGNSGWNNTTVLLSCDSYNCTIYGNSGGFYGGGMRFGNAVNCIFWGNGAPPVYDSPSVVTYSIVQGGYAGTGNLTSDPLFVNAANGDFHLQTNSPAINAGDPSIFDPDGTRSDIGALYFPFGPQPFFTNGSFEIINNHAAISPGPGVALYPGDTWLTGWTVGGPGGGDLFVQNGPLGTLNPYDGQEFIDFNGGNTAPGGSLSQTFTTTVGKLYTVSFAVGETGSGNVSLTATALALGGSILASNYCVPTSEVWTLFQFGFIAVSTNTTLTFKDTSSQTVAVDILLDAVSVSESTPPSLLANGSFEIPVVYSAVALNPGDTWLTGWTVGGPGHNMALYNGPAGGLSPFNGQQLVDFGGINTPSGGSLSQTFTTLVGQPYVVTYYVGESGTGNLNLSGTVFDAVGNLLASNRCVSVSGTWIPCQLSFSAATTNTTLVFTDTSVVDVQGGSLALDAISVTAPQTATASATPEVVNGFVVGATITARGFGYTNTPTVKIIGGGGSGAEAVAVVSNGVVIAIDVLDAGYGYTDTPLVVIDPPFIPNPVLGIAPLSFLTFSNLTVGGVYQLQQLAGWYWTNQPVNFTATNSVYSQMVSGLVGSGAYRLALNPVPAQAFAVPEVVNGFVVGATVTNGGSGYVTNPPVRVLGGGGTNAGGFSIVSGGVVTGITITNAGVGYTNTPTVQIGQPPAAAVSPTVQLVMRVDSSCLAPYDNYQIQFTPALGTPWGN